jgi:hypothetical protein
MEAWAQDTNVAVFPLHDQPYEALSYAWGDMTTAREMFIDGQSLAITQGLHDVLLHLRYKERPRRLWVDAVCISHADNAERTAQVAIMSYIYQYASRTLSWISLDSDNLDSEFVLGFLAWLGVPSNRFGTRASHGINNVGPKFRISTPLRSIIMSPLAHSVVLQQTVLLTTVDRSGSRRGH